jgi:hypothetical protein
LWIDGPGVIRGVLDDLGRYLADTGQTLSGLIGAAARQARPYADIPPSEQVPTPWMRTWTGA